MINSRRYDLDWLRILAFGVLIYFHTAIIFVPDVVPLIKNSELSNGLQIFVNISAQFRLSLLFFISGVGVAFARRRRTATRFIQERSQRLLLPLIFSMLLVVPPMVYTEKLFTGEFSDSFFSFYPQYFTQGVYPSGNFSWHHLWFVAYLYLYCLLGALVFSWLEKSNKQRLEGLCQAMRGFWIFLPILPLWCIELFLRPIFPGFRDLVNDWASFSHWFVVFVCGYLIANRESLLEFAISIRYFSLTLAILATTIAYALYGSFNFTISLHDPHVTSKYFGYTILQSSMVWASILSCLGLAGRFFRFSSNALAYLNEAVYPLFILHLPVIVIVGYWVVRLDWGVSMKFLFIANVTVVLILGVYHCLIRPYNIMRQLFGVRPVDN